MKKKNKTWLCITLIFLGNVLYCTKFDILLVEGFVKKNTTFSLQFFLKKLLKSYHDSYIFVCVLCKYKIVLLVYLPVNC